MVRVHGVWVCGVLVCRVQCLCGVCVCVCVCVRAPSRFTTVKHCARNIQTCNKDKNNITSTLCLFNRIFVDGGAWHSDASDSSPKFTLRLCDELRPQEERPLVTSVAIQWDGTHTPGRVEALGKKVTKKDPDIISLLFALAQSCGGRGGAGRLLPCPGPKRIYIFCGFVRRWPWIATPLYYNSVTRMHHSHSSRCQKYV